MRKRSGRLQTLVGDSGEKTAKSGARVWQPRLTLNLVNQVIFALALVLVIALVSLGNWINSRATLRILEATTDTAAVYLQTALQPNVQTLAQASELSPRDMEALGEIAARFEDQGQFLAIKIWRADGSILFASGASTSTDHSPEEIGPALKGEVLGRLSDLEDAEHASERALGVRLYEVYAPLYETGTDRVLAVGEFYQSADYVSRALLNSAKENWLGFLIVGTLTFVGFILIVRRASRIIQDQRDLLQHRLRQRIALSEANEELSRKINVATQNAIRVDQLTKKRFGAELHDGAAQLLGFLLIRIDQLENWLRSLAPDDRGPAEELLADIRDSAQQSMAEIRAVSAGLIAPHLDAGADLIETLNAVVRNHEARTGTSVETDIDGVRLPLSGAAIRTIARIAQEALSNAYKHADGAGQSLVAEIIEDNLVVRVCDRGPGLGEDCDPRPDGARLGVLGMTFRAESLGGTCILRNRSEGGVEMECILPLSNIRERQQ